MNKLNKKFMYFLFIVILLDTIIISSILNYRANNHKKLYSEIYNEYSKILDNSKINPEDINVSSDYLKNISDQNTKSNIVAIINIPSLNITYPVLSETTKKLLEIAPTKMWGPKPNTIGNFCIIGHNFEDGKMFSGLFKLETDDIVVLTTPSGYEKQYKVYNKYEAFEDDLSCTSQITNGKTEVTLITCTNNLRKRLILKCIEIE